MGKFDPIHDIISGASAFRLIAGGISFPHSQVNHGPGARQPRYTQQEETSDDHKQSECRPAGCPSRRECAPGERGASVPHGERDSGRAPAADSRRRDRRRANWIGWQVGVLISTPSSSGFQPTAEYSPLPHFRSARPHPAAEIRFENLGYADAARESWATFQRLQQAGELPAGTRFQVSLPTAVATVAFFVTPPIKRRRSRAMRPACSMNCARLSIPSRTINSPSSGMWPWSSVSWKGLFQRACRRMKQDLVAPPGAPG